MEYSRRSICSGSPTGFHNPIGAFRRKADYKNEYDELAILVKDERKHKLGYVPRARNHVMARLMDAGKLLYGVVTKILDPEDDDFPWKALTIAIYMED